MRRRGRVNVGGGLVAGLAACALTAFTVAAPAGTDLAGRVGARLLTHTTWTIRKSPNATVPGGQLNAVSCSATSACTAVGTNISTSGVNVTLAERWNGTSWQHQRTPNPPNDTVPIRSPDLLGVSCPTAHFCAAVGAYQVDSVGISLAEAWNGSRWTRQSFPGPVGSTSTNLRTVSCANAAFCEAVGQYTDSSGNNVSLAATWNGTLWAVQPTPNPPGASFTVLDAVSCAGAAACEAGGDFQLTSNPVALAESWNGSTWQIQPAFRPPGAAANNLSAVSCVSAVFCEAVGSHPERSGLATVSLAEAWNGAIWKIQRTPNPARATSRLRMNPAGVSCVSGRFCEAVGSSSSAAGAGAEMWDGGAWRRQAVPGGALKSLSRTSATFSMSAGSDGHADT